MWEDFKKFLEKANVVGLALAVIVGGDELAAGTLVERCAVPGVRERFYAITTAHRHRMELLEQLLSRSNEGASQGPAAATAP